MLYYQYRDSVERLITSVTDVIKYGAPDADEEAPENVNLALAACDNCLLRLTEVINCLPVELDGYPNKNFGPVVSPKDLQQVLSFLLPLAKMLDNQFPLLSYFPIRLFRDKSLILLEVMNLYCEWKSYFKDGDLPSEFESKSFMRGLTFSTPLISQEEKSFELLFENLRHSAKQAQRDIGHEFKKDYSQI